MRLIIKAVHGVVKGMGNALMKHSKQMSVITHIRTATFVISDIFIKFAVNLQIGCKCSNSTIEIPEQCVKSIQS